MPKEIEIRFTVSGEEDCRALEHALGEKGKMQATTYARMVLFERLKSDGHFKATQTIEAAR